MIGVLSLLGALLLYSRREGKTIFIFLESFLARQGGVGLGAFWEESTDCTARASPAANCGLRIVECGFHACVPNMLDHSDLGVLNAEIFSRKQEADG